MGEGPRNGLAAPRRVSHPGVGPDKGLFSSRRGVPSSWGCIHRGGRGNSLERHPRPLRRVQLSLLYKPTGCRELGDIIADLLC